MSELLAQQPDAKPSHHGGYGNDRDLLLEESIDNYGPCKSNDQLEYGTQLAQAMFERIDEETGEVNSFLMSPCLNVTSRTDATTTTTTS
eukprot:CAMPEP_0181079810 /NCGR_PEP_ID=MMETSP1071-20121207/2228_1 /TAXON_ID=35127 /ORGANISM="Thalassiosira sp., Strain NH16" /LENGTH=88 /DNA_ID=CAMNT_0023161237 /DNA_START=155 /DNA_END=418 /DNA_ORIENTATION=+